MRATYEKTFNVIVVELSAEEAEKYCAAEISERHMDLEKQGNTYYYTIPCGNRFYQMTQRQKGGIQPWGPDYLRQAIRAAVANRFVAWESQTGQEQFKKYKSEWNKVFQSLLRNVRLKFPTGRHPRGRLNKSEYKFREQWRDKYVCSR